MSARPLPPLLRQHQLSLFLPRALLRLRSSFLHAPNRSSRSRSSAEHAGVAKSSSLRVFRRAVWKARAIAIWSGEQGIKSDDTRMLCGGAKASAKFASWRERKMEACTSTGEHGRLLIWCAECKRRFILRTSDASTWHGTTSARTLITFSTKRLGDARAHFTTWLRCPHSSTFLTAFPN